MTMYNSKGERVSKAEELRSKTRSAYYQIGEMITRAVKAKEAYRAELTKLSGDAYKLYTADYMDELRREALAKLREANAALYEEMKLKLEALNVAAGEAHAYIDLTRTDVINAVNLVKSLGADLSLEDAQRIIGQFEGDQSSLRLLRSAFQSSGSLSGAGQLDRMIYSDSEAATALAHAVEQVFAQENGSLNNLAATAGRYARLDGMPDVIDTTPDPRGVIEAAYRGAGLPMPTD